MAWDERWMVGRVGFIPCQELRGLAADAGCVTKVLSIEY